MKFNIDILKGRHVLSGVGTVSIEEGYVLEIDGKLYIVYEQEDDEYRSDCAIQQIDEDEVYSKVSMVGFPDQEVDIVIGNTFDSPFSRGVALESFDVINPQDKSVILNAWTMDWQDYYPCAQFAYHPENLPINK